MEARTVVVILVPRASVTAMMAARVCVCVCVRARVCARVRIIYIYVYIGVCVCVRVSMYVCVCVCVVIRALAMLAVTGLVLMAAFAVAGATMAVLGIVNAVVAVVGTAPWAVLVARSEADASVHAAADAGGVGAMRVALVLPACLQLLWLLVMHPLLPLA